MSDSPTLEAFVTGNSLLKGQSEGLSAENITAGALGLLLENNNLGNIGDPIPNYTFYLDNDSTGSMTLYNREDITIDPADFDELENLLKVQENSEGSNGMLSDAPTADTGTISIAPKPPL